MCVLVVEGGDCVCVLVVEGGDCVCVLVVEDGDCVCVLVVEGGDCVSRSDYDGTATSISPLYLSVSVVGLDQARLEM